MNFDYDLFVIGAGSGGLAASKRAASYGAKVAIAEREDVGGTCVIRGCVPKKFLVFSSRFSAQFQDSQGYGWTAAQPKLNWNQLLDTIDREVQRLSSLHISLLEKAGVELIPGHARFVDPHSITINGRLIRARKILIAVGGQPTIPSIPGAERAITSRDVFRLKKQPKHIVIWGGGYIGCEFACILRGLGSEVTLVIRKDQILQGFDHDMGKLIQDDMQQQGIRIITNSQVKHIEKLTEAVQVHLGGSTQDIISADAILAATGRAPNIANLGLEMLQLDRVHSDSEDDSVNTIWVNGFSQTSQPHIFAVGDVTNRMNLTPVAIGEGRAFADTEFGQQKRSLSHDNVPTAIFTTPEAATVGLSESAARKKYGSDAIKTYVTSFRPMYHSLAGRSAKTFMKLVVETSSDKVLGAHMVGDHAAEIIQGLAISVKLGARKSDFDATVGIHPTVAEEFVTMR